MEKLPSKYSTQSTKPAKNGKVNIVTVEISREEKYILTVGFEVNYPEAFYNNVLNLSVDFGHAFFYTSRSSPLSEVDIVDTFFSFGPLELGAGGKITDEYNGKRPGNTRYNISEKTKMFRLRISKAQAEKIKKNSAELTIKVDNRDVFYDVSYNNTCAETARDILSASLVITPDGHSPVIGTGNIISDAVGYSLALVNPYMWFHKFQSSYGEPISWYGKTGKIKAQPDEEKDEEGYRIKLSKSWILSPGDAAPLPDDKRQFIHDDIRNQ